MLKVTKPATVLQTLKLHQLVMHPSKMPFFLIQMLHSQLKICAE